MPWVNGVFGKACLPAQQERIKAGMAQILKEALQKDERGLTVTFQEAHGFFRAGEACADGAMMEIKYIGQFPEIVKQELSRRTAYLLHEALGVPLQRVSILISEFSAENWGGKVGDFTGGKP